MRVPREQDASAHLILHETARVGEVPAQERAFTLHILRRRFALWLRDAGAQVRDPSFFLKYLSPCRRETSARVFRGLLLHALLRRLFAARHVLCLRAHAFLSASALCAACLPSSISMM